MTNKVKYPIYAETILIHDSEKLMYNKPVSLQQLVTRAINLKIMMDRLNKDTNYLSFKKNENEYKLVKKEIFNFSFKVGSPANSFWYDFVKVLSRYGRFKNRLHVSTRKD